MAHCPKISIVTPSYNQAQFIERTIASVVFQSYPNKEYIIMDGGSTDGTVEIIKKYESRITYWRSAPDGGQTAAICEGLNRATGDILLYLNSDDMLLPGALWAYAKALEGKEKAWAIGRLAIIDAEDRLLTYRPNYPVTIKDLWYNFYIVHQEGTCFTRALYEETGGFNPSYHYSMDFHMWLRMASICSPVLVRQYTAAFRVTPTQKSANRGKYSEEVNRAFAEARQWRIARGLSEFPRRPLLRGHAFTVAKALYYFWVGGIDVIKGIYRFREGNLDTTIFSDKVRNNRS